ncbi:hypothetical protein Daus18300_004190 [Diaporthe australafricana]|uniref:Uncharacterized protein n=1 Tax=Diaporthe australafricana TaxID=127596 RepID=A0ABR3XAR8_9PEZI
MANRRQYLKHLTVPQLLIERKECRDDYEFYQRRIDHLKQHMVCLQMDLAATEAQRSELEQEARRRGVSNDAIIASGQFLVQQGLFQQQEEDAEQENAPIGQGKMQVEEEEVPITKKEDDAGDCGDECIGDDNDSHDPVAVKIEAEER